MAIPQSLKDKKVKLNFFQKNSDVLVALTAHNSYLETQPSVRLTTADIQDFNKLVGESAAFYTDEMVRFIESCLKIQEELEITLSNYDQARKWYEFKTHYWKNLGQKPEHDKKTFQLLHGSNKKDYIMEKGDLLVRGSFALSQLSALWGFFFFIAKRDRRSIFVPGLYMFVASLALGFLTLAALAYRRQCQAAEAYEKFLTEATSTGTAGVNVEISDPQRNESVAAGTAGVNVEILELQTNESVAVKQNNKYTFFDDKVAYLENKIEALEVPKVKK